MKNTLLFVFALILAACSEYPKDAKNYNLQHIGSDFNLEVYSNGGEFFIDKKGPKDGVTLKPKIIMLAYMGDKCALCMDYIVTLNSLADKNKTLLILAIAPSGLTKELEERDNFMLFSSQTLLADITSKLNIPFDRKSSENMPLFILYDSHGKYANYYQGYIPEEILSFELKKLEG